MQGYVCRLCFTMITDNNHVYLEKVKRTKLEDITAELNLKVVRKGVVCRSCSENIEKFANFKSACLKCFGVSASSTLSLSDLSRLDLQLQEGQISRNIAGATVRSCRLCCGNTGLFEIEHDVLLHMVKIYLPEIESEATLEDFTVCSECCKYLTNHYINSIRHSLAIETKFVNYCQPTDDFSLSMDDIVKFNQTIFHEPDNIDKKNVKLLDETPKRASHIHSSGIKYETEDISNKELVIHLTKDDKLNFKTEELIIKDECEDDEEYLDKCKWKKQNGIPLTAYQCNQCPFATYNRSTLGSHVRTKHATEIFNCNQCEYRSKIKWNLTTHTRLKHSDRRPFKCNNCDYAAKCKTTLKAHIFRLHTNVEIEKVFKCKYCSHKTHEEKYLFEHIRYVHTEKKIKCPKCDFTTTRKDTINKHMRYLHPEKILSLKCPDCPYITSRQDTYKRHIRQHKNTNPETYKCNDCPYQCKEKGRMVRHSRTHKQSENLPTYTCDLCSYTTKIKVYIASHKRRVHISDENLFECSICHKKTKTKADLTKHMIVHKSGNELVWHSCDVCSYKTKHKRTIKQHMLLHKPLEEIKLFKCDLCPYQAKQKSNLTTHTKTMHSSVDDIVWYRCDKCEHRTKSKYLLETHMLVHKNKSEVETFQCYTCGFEMKYKSCLQKHMLQHMEPGRCKMYKCKMCDFETKYKGYLRTHVTFH